MHIIGICISSCTEGGILDPVPEDPLNAQKDSKI